VNLAIYTAHADIQQLRAELNAARAIVTAYRVAVERCAGWHEAELALFAALDDLTEEG
jgi:hypothetical protein